SILEGTLAQVCAPRPTREIDLDRTVHWHHAGRAVTANDHRTEVARIHAVPLDQLAARRHELVERILHLHAIDLARVEQPLEMVLETKDRWPAWCVIATDP